MIEILTITFYLSISGLVISKAKEFTLPFYIIFNVFNDYLFYSIGFSAGEGQIYKTFNEVFFTVLLAVYLANKVLEGRLNLHRGLFFLLAIGGLTLGYGAVQNGLLKAYLDFKEIFLPILTLLLLYELKAFDTKTYKFVTYLFLSCALINSLIAIMDYMSFDGNYLNYWRYDLLLSAKTNRDDSFITHFIEYQLVRNGNLRASGLFASALEFAFFTAGNLIVSLHFLLKSSSLRNICILAIISCTLIVGIYVSQVRTAYLIVFGYIAIQIFIKHIKNYRHVMNSLYIAFPIGIICLFFLLENQLDSSSIQRVYQYRQILNSPALIIPQGLGTFPQAFDSFFLFLYANIGILSLVVFSYFFKTMGMAIRSFSANEDKCYAYIMAILITSFWVMSIQHFAGSLYYIFIIYNMLMIRPLLDLGKQ